MSDNDRVLIAGAGPVGCSAALYLAQRGIPVTLVEAAATLPEDLRASTFHPPTLDMLDDLGVVDQLLEQGIVCPGMAVPGCARRSDRELGPRCLEGRHSAPI